MSAASHRSRPRSARAAPRIPGPLAGATAALVALLVLPLPKGVAAESPDAAGGDPPPAPRLEILGGVAAFEVGGRLRGRATSLGEGDHRVEWRDAHGMLDSRVVAGQGGFAFDLSYPRERANEVVLVRGEGRGDKEVCRLPFEIALPASSRGLVRVLVPGDEGEARADFPAEAVLWNAAAQEKPPDTQGRDLVIDLAIEALGGGPAPEQWGARAAREGTPSREVRVRVPCLNDPAFRAEVREHVKRALASPAAKGSAVVSLGTGLSATYRGAPYDFCTSEHCEAAFREFLRRKYGGREALGRAWGVPVASFEDAGPCSLAELGFPHATRYTAWADHLEFRDATFAAFLDEVVGEVRAAAPAARVGMFGLGRPAAYGGADFDLLGRVLDWRGSEWKAGSRRLVEAFGPPWGALAFGGNAAGRDTAQTKTRAARAVSGLFAGERIFFLRPGEEAAARALGELPRGLGRIMGMSAPPAPKPRGSESADAATPAVALVYSQPSVRASFIQDSLGLGLPWDPSPLAPTKTLVPPGATDGGREGAWALAWEAWCSLLGDLGVTFACVSERDIARGDLAAKGIKAAVLVRQMSVSSDVAGAIERFARSGGVVIADAGPGLFDGAMARAGEGALRDLLGVEHGTVKFSEIGPKRAAVAQGALRYAGQSEGPSFFPHPGQLGVGPAQSGLGLAGARAEGMFGDVPCLAVNPCGGGWGVMLNLAITPYPGLRLAPGGGRALRSLLRGVLARAGVSPAVELRYADDAAPPPWVCVRDAGSARFVIVRRDAPGRRGAGAVKTRLTVQTDALPAVHDPLEGVFVGWTRDVKASLAPGELRVFTLLPYRLRSILAEPGGRPPDAKRPGPERFEVTLRREGEGAWAPHVLNVCIEGPDGRPRPELARIVDVAGGRAEFVVPFAASDRAGLWTLRLRDAATGVGALRRFVRSRGP